MASAASKDGTSIAFDQSGDGPPIIVVGGALEYRSIDPSSGQLAALLAGRFTVFRYDRRGRGESGDTAPYEVEREIEDLAALIDEAGGSAFVVGGSSGAVIGLDASAAGLGISRLACYEPPFIVDDSRPPLPHDYIHRLVELASSGRTGDAVEYFLTTGVGMPAEAVTAMREAPFWAGLEAVAHTLAYDGAVMGDTMAGNPLPTERWASVTIPTLVMDGGASPAWARNAVEALGAALPNAHRRTLEGQTHQVAPEALAPVLEEFFGG
jgi:pimeloyl-ACP methyl ester carboxylesterase